MGKYPRLSHKEIRDEIIKRTHQNRQVVMAIMDAHRDIMREALCNGVEVGIADLAILTFRDHPPRPAGEYWDGFTKTRHYFPDRPGYYTLAVTPKEPLRQGIKAGTVYGKSCTKEEWLAWLDEYHPNTKRRLHWQDDCEEVDDEQQDE